MKKSVAYAAIGVLVAASAGMLWLSRDGATTGAAAANGSAADAGAAIVASGAAEGIAGSATHFVTGLENLPGSLRGTEAPDGLQVDANGHLKVTHALRDLFDYFLAAVGEEPIDATLARMHAYVRNRLKDPAQHEALVILDGYISYKKALSAMPPPASPTSAGNNYNTDAIRQQMDLVASMRSQYLAVDVIQIFFGDEDAYDHYTMERLQLLQNKSLSDSQRAQQLAALEQQLPASVRESMKTVNQVQNLQALTDDCRKRNCSAGELRQLRENLVGAPAADRLEALDKDNAAWDQRMNTWFNQRATIMANTSLSDGERQAQIDTARNSQFNQQEQIRVEALERIHDGGGMPQAGR